MAEPFGQPIGDHEALERTHSPLVAKAPDPGIATANWVPGPC